MKAGKTISDDLKVKLFDEVVRIMIDCENREDVTKEEIKKYGNPCGMAGYKILRLFYDNKVVEPGMDGRLDV